VTALAYCAPGRELATAMSFAFAGLRADRIVPTSLLSGDRVFVIDDGQWNGTVVITPQGGPRP